MQLEKNFRAQLVGKTLYETLGELIRMNFLDESEKLRKEFKISDATERLYFYRINVYKIVEFRLIFNRFLSWWHLKAKNLAKGSHWDELEKFSKSKKSLIGYEPFVYYCMDMSNVQEAKKYFPKVAPDHRFKCLIKMK